jgi:hypothetical protein
MALKSVQELHFGHVPLLTKEPTALAKRERDCLVSIRSDYGQCLASGSVFRWNSPALLAAPPATARGVSGVAVALIYPEPANWALAARRR